MQRRRIPVLDPMFDRISMLLWPRFKQIFDLNIRSLKLRIPNVKKLGAFDLGPHYTSKRYAEFVSSIILLHITHPSISTPVDAVGKDDNSMVGLSGGELMIQQDLQLLRVEFINFLERMATCFGSFKDQRVFFINNYDSILIIFQERGILSDEMQRFENLLMAQRELFAEEEIKTFFPKLVAFVLQSEQIFADAAASGLGETPKIVLDEVICEALVRDFAANWKIGIQQINDEVLKYFASFRNGMEILKQVLTQLLLYYTRFQDLIKKSFPRPPTFSRDIVSTATILMEIKRYSRTF
jgi:vacuolar protein sorting-associated protein 52